jgi:uncharacterized protein (TIGR02594 family)
MTEPIKKLTAYDIAKQEVGVKEIRGDIDNPRILEYHKATLLKAHHDEIPWCSAFVCWCLEMAGIESTRSARARSFLYWGESANIPAEGDIAVFRRAGSETLGHVAFFVCYQGDFIHCLGGNQSDAVCYRNFKREDLLGFRRTKTS